MIAANVWHWWIGVILTLAGVGAVLSLGAGYVRSVSSKRFPPKSHSNEL